LEISGLLDLGVSVPSFHLLAAIGKSVIRGAGRWDTEIVRYLPIRIPRLGTQGSVEESCLSRELSFERVVFASPRSLEEDKCSDVTRLTRFETP
jgi:hypothetical protein